MFRRTCGWLVCFLHYLPRTRGCGCGWHPAFPAPSVLMRGTSMQSSDFSCRENERVCLVNESATKCPLQLGCVVGHRIIVCPALSGELLMSELGLRMSNLAILWLEYVEQQVQEEQCLVP